MHRTSFIGSISMKNSTREGHSKKSKKQEECKEIQDSIKKTLRMCSKTTKFCVTYSVLKIGHMILNQNHSLNCILSSRHSFEAFES